AGDLRGRTQIFAAIDLSGEWLAGRTEIGHVLAGRRGGPARREAREAQLRPLADGAEPDVDHLDRLVRRMVRVAQLVQFVERGADRLPLALPELLDGDRHLQRKLLAHVTQVE